MVCRQARTPHHEQRDGQKMLDGAHQHLGNHSQAVQVAEHLQEGKGRWKASMSSMQFRRVDCLAEAGRFEHCTCDTSLHPHSRPLATPSRTLSTRSTRKERRMRRVRMDLRELPLAPICRAGQGEGGQATVLRQLPASRYR